MNSVKRVLIVEDDRAIYPILSRMIERINGNAGIEFVASAEDAEPYRYEDFYEKLSPHLAEDAPTEAERTGKTFIDPPERELFAKKMTFVSIALLAVGFFAYLGVQMERFPLH
jgi:hypothetical protein